MINMIHISMHFCKTFTSQLASSHSSKTTSPTYQTIYKPKSFFISNLPQAYVIHNPLFPNVKTFTIKLFPLVLKFMVKTKTSLCILADNSPLKRTFSPTKQRNINKRKNQGFLKYSHSFKWFILECVSSPISNFQNHTSSQIHHPHHSSSYHPTPSLIADQTAILSP